jgi:hypothetical protein
MELELPGGLWQDGRLQRHAVLRDLNGDLELRFARRLAQGGSWPDCLTDLLDVAVERCAERPADRATLAGLCVADRQWLLLHLLRAWQGDALWLTSECPRCGTRLDHGLQRSAIPVRPAGSGFPFTEVELGGRSLALRVPTGDDQSAVATLDDADAARALARRCLLDDGAMVELDDAALRAIGAALEAVAPELAATLQVRCAHCGLEHEFDFDPCAIEPAATDALFDDVHTIALAYHWSERDILALPRERRQRYLERIATCSTPAT